jgi:hypothetical protein
MVSRAEGDWAEIDGRTSEGAKFIANGATTAGRRPARSMFCGDGYATFTGDKPAVTRIAQD